jgi:hypothetical protein
MSDQSDRPKGRLRRWLDRRREGQRRAAEMTARRKAVRREDFDRASKRGNVGSGDPGPFGGM